MATNKYGDYALHGLSHRESAAVVDLLRSRGWGVHRTWRGEIVVLDIPPIKLRMMLERFPHASFRPLD